MPMRVLRLFLLGTCFVSLPGWAQDATAWMARMSEALATLDYQGDLVYQHGSQLETLRIYHASGADGGRERLLTLSGAPREVIRGAGQVRCVGTSDQSTSYGHGMLQSPLMAPFGGAGASSLGRHYEAVLGGVERIAEHEAQLVEVRPRDAFRYGYRFWLERNSGLPLKSLRFGADGRPVEQLMFTRVTLGERPSDADLGSDVLQAAPGVALDLPQAMETRLASGWTVLDPPAGFRLTMQQPPAPRSSEHQVYSDGVANVSVYVEPLQAKVPAFSGPASRGAINLYGRVLDGRQVTVLGDVPAATVERFAQGVSFDAGS